MISTISAPTPRASSPGRPRVDREKRRNTAITALLTEADAQRVYQLGNDHPAGMSGFVRDAIAAYLFQHENAQ